MADLLGRSLQIELNSGEGRIFFHEHRKRLNQQQNCQTNESSINKFEHEGDERKRKRNSDCACVV
jgi:hypothetical protein